MINVNSIPQAPVLRPSMREFSNFAHYVSQVEQQYRKNHGMVKIVPPKQWKSRKDNYEQILKNLTITTAQYQTLYGKPHDFYYQCRNKPTAEPITLQQYQTLAASKAQEISHLKTIDQVEEYFWSNLNKLGSELYCPNIPISLMDGQSGQWDFGDLKSVFNQVVTEKIKGLNTPFVFLGAYGTFFNWHIEDLDLSALNLMHEGQPKMWYGVPPGHRGTLERILKDHFELENMSCPNFLRHKSTFTNPYLVKQKYPSLPMTKMTQRPGDICLVFSQAYHSGFNAGYNVNEAVNHGDRHWLEQYMKFRGCKCPKQIGVQLDQPLFYENILKSPYYQSIKNEKAFLKIAEEVRLDQVAEEAFNADNEEEVERQITLSKEKKINKGQRQIYVEKYRRYFPLNPGGYKVECQRCKEWRSVSQTDLEKYSKKKFTCNMVKKSCKKNRQAVKTSKVKTNRRQIVEKVQRRVLRNRSK